MANSNQNKYESYLTNLLEELKFESGSGLIASLVEKFSVSAVYARKIVSRAVSNKKIESSYPHTFGKNQFIYFNIGYELNKTGIKDVARKFRPPLYRLLEYMDNTAIISYYEALKITASPLEKKSSKVSTLEEILELLKSFNIIYRKRDFNNVIYLIYKYNDEELESSMEATLMANHYSKMILDCSILYDILRWLANSNLIDSSNFIYRNKKTPAIGASHNNLIWDAFGYTRATGINQVLGALADTIEKKTLVVLDVQLSSEYSEIHLDAFYSRIQINRNSVSEGTRKTLPIIIFRECASHTLNKIRKLGIIAFDIGAIFGNKIYDILNRTQKLSVMFRESDDIDLSVAKILQVIDHAGQNDALRDLKGTLFEFLMYPLLRNLYPNSIIQRGRTLSKVNSDGTKEYYEYDYIIHSNNPAEILLVELKGYNSSANISKGDFQTKNTLKWFFGRTVPFARSFFKQEVDQGSTLKACFITSANIYDEGKEYLETLNNGSLKSISLDVGYGREDLENLLKVRGFTKEIMILNKFYLKEKV